jgi:hypothetical protein
MALLAAGTPERSDLAIALLAGHGQLFVQSFTNDPLRPTDDLQSLAPPEAAAAIGASRVIGSGAEALVAARGFGRAEPGEARAADARLLPATLRTLPPSPIYGRAPDARPMP